MKKVLCRAVVLSVYLFASLPFCFAQSTIPENNRAVLTKKSEYMPHNPAWNPSAKEADEAISAAFNFLYNADENKKYSGYLQGEMMRIRMNFASYRVQLVGIMVDGKKRIHCNFFPADEGANYWRESYVMVSDGGYNFWRIDYDMETKKCVNFESNGYA